MLQDFFHFVAEHYLLSLAFVVISLALLFEELRGKASGSNVSPSTATHLINRERATVVDTRERDAFTAGHIVNAINISQNDLLKSDKLKKMQTKPIILVCKQGQTTPAMASKLRKQGFTSVYVLKGGLDAWKDSGLPVVK